MRARSFGKESDMLYRKMLRDLKQNLVQFLAIFVMTFLAMMVVEGFDSESVGSSVSMERYLQETNFKDLEIQGASFSYGDIETLRHLPGVEDVDGIYQTSGKATLDSERKLLLNYIESSQVSTMHLVEGEPYQEGIAGIWLDARFCEAMGISVGDTIRISTGNVSFQEIVKGIVYSPEYIYYIPDASYVEPVYGEYGFAYLDIGERPQSEDGFNKLLVKASGVKGQLSLTEEEQRLIDTLRPEIKEALEDENLVVLTKTQDDGYHYYLEQLNGGNAIGVVFPIMFFGIALLGILTTMTRLTARQRTQIGTLKALGFSNRTIMLHYMSYGVVIAFLGAVLGGITGYYTLGMLRYDDTMYYFCNPYECLMLSPKPFIDIAAITGLAALTAYLSNKRILTENASNILKPEPPRVTDAGWLEKTPVWNRLGFATRWNLRDVWRNKLRTCISIFGVAICTMLLFSALSFYECLEFRPLWMYDELVKAKYKIEFHEDADYGTVYDYAEAYSGQMIEEAEATIYGKTGERAGTIVVADRGNCYLYQDMDGEYRQMPEKGAAISYKMAKLLDLQVGDYVTWKLAGEKETHSARITEIYKNPVTQGLTFSRSTWEQMHNTFEPTEIYTNVTVPEELEERQEINAVHMTGRLKAAMESVNEINYALSEYMIVAAIVLGIVVLYNLGMLSFVEKAREIATLKVLGFQTVTIRQILQQQNLAVTAVGILPGIPCGFCLLQQLLEMMGEDVDFLIELSPMPYLVTVLGVFMVSVLVNGYISSKVKLINMVEALKGVE